MFLFFFSSLFLRFRLICAISRTPFPKWKTERKNEGKEEVEEVEQKGFRLGKGEGKEQEIAR